MNETTGFFSMDCRLQWNYCRPAPGAPVPVSTKIQFPKTEFIFKSTYSEVVT